MFNNYFMKFISQLLLISCVKLSWEDELIFIFAINYYNVTLLLKSYINITYYFKLFSVETINKN